MNRKSVPLAVLGCLLVFVFSMTFTIAVDVQAGPSDCCFYDCAPGCGPPQVQGVVPTHLEGCDPVGRLHACWIADCICT